MRRTTNAVLALLGLASSSLAQNVTTQISLDSGSIAAGEDIVVHIHNATTDFWPGTTESIHTHFHFGITNSMTGVRMCTLLSDQGLIPASPDDTNNNNPKYKLLSPNEGEINLGPFPADIGPPGAFYSITMTGFTNTNNSEDYKLPNAQVSNPGIFDSPYFHAEKMTGRFTPLEEPGLYKYGDRQIALFTEIPCESYRCAQNCAALQFPTGTKAWARNSTWANCFEECEGTWINWEFIDQTREAGDLEWFGDVYKERFSFERDDGVVRGQESAVKEDCPGCEGVGKTQCGVAGCCGEGEYCWRFERCVNVTVGFQEEWVKGTGARVDDRIDGDGDICEVKEEDTGKDEGEEKKGAANVVGVDRGSWALVVAGVVAVGSVWF